MFCKKLDVLKINFNILMFNLGLMSTVFESKIAEIISSK
jgi:hypothetical protein